MAEIDRKKELLKALLAEEREESPLSIDDSRRQGAELNRRYERLLEVNQFRPGMLAQWKDGLKNKRRPRYGEPVVIVDVLTKPEVNTDKEAGSAYFREPLDVIAGFVDDDDDFILFHFDSRRFRPFDR